MTGRKLGRISACDLLRSLCSLYALITIDQSPFQEPCPKLSLQQGLGPAHLHHAPGLSYIVMSRPTHAQTSARRTPGSQLAPDDAHGMQLHLCTSALSRDDSDSVPFQTLFSLSPAAAYVATAACPPLTLTGAHRFPASQCYIDASVT